MLKTLIRPSIMFLLMLLLMAAMTFKDGSRVSANPPTAVYYQPRQSYHGYSNQAYYPTYQQSYQTYYQPPTYNYNNYNQYVYPAVAPLNTSAYVQPNAVLSGAVSYSQQIVTSASSTQSILSAANAFASADATLSERFVASQEAIASEMRALREDKMRAAGMVPSPSYASRAPVEDSAWAAKFRISCIKCHKGAESEKGFALFDDDGKYIPVKPEDVPKLIFRLTTTGKLRMPPGGNMLSPEDKDAMISGVITDPAGQQQKATAKKSLPEEIDPKKVKDDKDKGEGKDGF